MRYDSEFKTKEEKKNRDTFAIVIAILLILLTLGIAIAAIVINVKKHNDDLDNKSASNDSLKAVDPKDPGVKPIYDANGKVVVRIPSKDSPLAGEGPNAGVAFPNGQPVITNPTAQDLLKGINNNAFFDKNGIPISPEQMKTGTVAFYYDANGNGRFDSSDLALTTDQSAFVNNIGLGLNSANTESSVALSRFTMNDASNSASSANIGINDVLATGYATAALNTKQEFKLNNLSLGGVTYTSNSSPIEVYNRTVASSGYNSFVTNLDNYYNMLGAQTGYSNLFKNVPSTANLGGYASAASINNNTAAIQKQLIEQSAAAARSLATQYRQDAILLDKAGLSSVNVTRDATNLDNFASRIVEVARTGNSLTSYNSLSIPSSFANIESCAVDLYNKGYSYTSIPSISSTVPYNQNVYNYLNNRGAFSNEMLERIDFNIRNASIRDGSRRHDMNDDAPYYRSSSLLGM